MNEVVPKKNKHARYGFDHHRISSEVITRGLSIWLEFKDGGVAAGGIIAGGKVLCRL